MEQQRCCRIELLAGTKLAYLRRIPSYSARIRLEDHDGNETGMVFVILTDLDSTFCHEKVELLSLEEANYANARPF